MCLDTVDKKPTVVEGEGWKTFYCDTYGHLNYGARGGRVPRTGKWITDKACGIITTFCGGTYPKGFHVYMDYPQYSSNPGTRKVSYRNVVATGTQSKDNIAVAREIYIHPKPTPSVR